MEKIHLTRIFFFNKYFFKCEPQPISNIRKLSLNFFGRFIRKLSLNFFGRFIRKLSLNFFVGFSFFLSEFKKSFFFKPRTKLLISSSFKISRKRNLLPPLRIFYKKIDGKICISFFSFFSLQNIIHSYFHNH